MKSARRLLIPIDFSEASKTVVRYALNDKQLEHDILVLLHSYRLIFDGFSSYHDSPRDLKTMLENQLLDTYSSFHQDLELSEITSQIEFRMEVGFIVNSIHTICKESSIDMILYALKRNKPNQILSDLLSLDCAPIMLISEHVDVHSRQPLTTKEISKQDFKNNWDQYLSDLDLDSNLSYTVLPQ